MDSVELIASATTAIRTNKTRSVLTTLGIIIGVASVILLVSIGTGLQSFVTKQFADLGSNLLFIAPGKVNIRSGGGPPISAEAKFTFDDVRAISLLGTPITGAFGSIIKPATAKYLNKTYDVTTAGVPAEYAKIRNIKVARGEFFNQSMVERSQLVVVLGPKVVEKLFRVGEEPLGKIVEVSGKKLKVIGVAESKGGGLGGGTGDIDSYVYLPVTAAAKIFGVKKPASMAVSVDKAENIGIGTAMLKRYFERRRLTSDDYTILEPKEILEQINSFLGVVTAALSGIAAISLLVGGIGIANIMLVSVTERTREIGLRKAVGAKPRDILLQFLIEAVVLSVVGGLIGIAIGGGFSLLLRKFIQTEVTLGSVLLSFGVAAGVGIIAGLAPAVRASRLDPIAALRYE